MADSSSKSALTYMVHVCLYVCMHCACMCAHSYMCVLPLLEVCYISMETMSLQDSAVILHKGSWTWRWMLY